jgi:hypothetical protein
MAAAVSALGDEAFTAARLAGLRMSVEQAVVFAKDGPWLPAPARPDARR